MIVLALDTTTRAGSMALFVDGVLHAGVGDATRTHGERLPAEWLAWLGSHGCSLLDVSLLAVVAGPGSFTGLRVGIAAAQGLALVRGLRIVPVPTLEAMADAWIEQAVAPAPLALVVCLDGQRGDVFFAAWRIEPGRPPRREVVLIEPRVGRPDDVREQIARRIDQLPVVIADAGAVPLAAVAARTAAEHPERAVSPHAIRPIYIRRPDAELARERARATTPAEDPSSFVVTRASIAEDLSEVEALQRRAFTNAWGAEAIRWELANTDVARLYVMRGPAGAIVAYCACWLLFDELHINSLAVDEAWRRRGVAHRLLGFVFRDTVAAGARSATLEVRESNRAARALYEGLGFRVEAVRRDYYQDPREDALILWQRRLR